MWPGCPHDGQEGIGSTSRKLPELRWDNPFTQTVGCLHSRRHDRNRDRLRQANSEWYRGMRRRRYVVTFSSTERGLCVALPHGVVGRLGSLARICVIGGSCSSVTLESRRAVFRPYVRAEDSTRADISQRPDDSAVLTFYALGDWGTGDQTQRGVATTLQPDVAALGRRRTRPFVLGLGDNAYTSGLDTKSAQGKHVFSLRH